MLSSMTSLFSVYRHRHFGMASLVGLNVLLFSSEVGLSGLPFNGS